MRRPVRLLIFLAAILMKTPILFAAGPSAVWLSKLGDMEETTPKSQLPIKVKNPLPQGNEGMSRYFNQNGYRLDFEGAPLLSASTPLVELNDDQQELSVSFHAGISHQADACRNGTLPDEALCRKEVETRVGEFKSLKEDIARLKEITEQARKYNRERTNFKKTDIEQNRIFKELVKAKAVVFEKVIRPQESDTDEEAVRKKIILRIEKLYQQMTEMSSEVYGIRGNRISPDLTKTPIPLLYSAFDNDENKIPAKNMEKEKIFIQHREELKILYQQLDDLSRRLGLLKGGEVMSGPNTGDNYQSLELDNHGGFNSSPRAVMMRKEPEWYLKNGNSLEVDALKQHSEKSERLLVKEMKRSQSELPAYALDPVTPMPCGSV